MNKQVLVIEDELPLSTVIKQKLESNGFMVTTARTAEQAMNYIDELQNIDVIWLDHYLLGKESGLDILAKLKADGSKYQDIPVFVVSNTASEESVQSYMRLGATKYFVKAEHKLGEIVDDVIECIQKEV